MKSVLFYASFHHGNTKKIAEAIAAELGAEAVPCLEADKFSIAECGLIGFGSGVYFRKFHRSMYKLLDGLPEVENKRAFLFSTSGVGKNRLLNIAHEDFRKKLQKKNFVVEDEFNCRGYDTYGILKLTGGMNRGRPDEKDLERARKFAESLKKV